MGKPTPLVPKGKVNPKLFNTSLNKLRLVVSDTDFAGYTDDNSIYLLYFKHMKMLDFKNVGLLLKLAFPYLKNPQHSL